MIELAAAAATALGWMVAVCWASQRSAERRERDKDQAG